jgi:outer membrane protein assembly factor BamB
VSRTLLPVSACLAAACGPAAAPHPLPFDPLPATRGAPATVREVDLAPTAAAEPGTERRAFWADPPAPRIVGEIRTDGPVRAEVAVARGACARRRTEDCACADDRILAASLSGTVTAFAPSGTTLWHWGCGAPITASPVATGEGAVLVACDDGTIAALDVGDGEERWRLSRAAREASDIAWSPWSETLFLGAAGMVAVHRSGAVAWARPEPGPFFGRPALSGRIVVFAGLDAAAYGVDAATGELRWRRELDGGSEGGVLELATGDVVVATLPGRVRCFSLPGGALRWEAAVGEMIRGRPAQGADGTILVPLMDGAVAGIDAEAGVVLWRHPVPAPVLATPLPVVRDGAAAGEAEAVAGDRHGFLYGLAYPARNAPAAPALAAPVERWRLNLGLPVEARPALEGATLLVGLEDGRVVRVAPGPPACGPAVDPDPAVRGGGP